MGHDYQKYVTPCRPSGFHDQLHFSPGDDEILEDEGETDGELQRDSLDRFHRSGGDASSPMVTPGRIEMAGALDSDANALLQADFDHDAETEESEDWDIEYMPPRISGMS